jgi:hypothetical protein
MVINILTILSHIQFRSPESHVPEGQNLYHNAIGQHLVQSYQR